MATLDSKPAPGNMAGKDTRAELCARADEGYTREEVSAMSFGWKLRTETPAIKAAWKVVHDGDSLGMLQAPDGRIFRIQQLGAGLVDGWGNAGDNDAICAMLAQSPAAPAPSPSGRRAAVCA